MDAILVAETGFTILLTGITLSLIYWCLKLRVPPVPSSHKHKYVLQKCLPNIVRGDIYDLGCGIGSLLAVLEKKYPNSNVMGIECSPVPFFISKVRFCRKKKVVVYRKNFLEHMPGQPGLIVCYLYGDAMRQIAGHLKKHTRQEIYLVSHTFRLPGYTPLVTRQCDDLYRTPVYLYLIQPQKP